MMKSNIKSICQSVTEAFEVQSSNYYLLEPRTVQTFAAVETADAAVEWDAIFGSSAVTTPASPWAPRRSAAFFGGPEVPWRPAHLEALRSADAQRPCAPHALLRQRDRIVAAPGAGAVDGGAPCPAWPTSSLPPPPGGIATQEVVDALLDD